MNEKLEIKIKQIMPLLNEKQLRRYLGSEAEALGFGGVETIVRISGKSRNTIVSGMKENKEIDNAPKRVRRIGGGRKSLKENTPK